MLSIPISLIIGKSFFNENSLSTIAYIPLDDRPCNYDRVIMAGKAMGIKVLVPDTKQHPQPNLFATKLDNQPLNSTGSNLGSPDLIVKWLNDVSSTEDIDGYILSIDMIMSGGLVGSRLEHNKEDISNEINRFSKVLEIVGDKPVYMFDTVMRLASTTAFNDYKLSEYNATREYGKEKRKEYNSFEEIINNYNINEVGNPIDYSAYGLSTEQFNSYLNSRKRKFKINVDVHNLVKDKKNIFLAYGIDDSSSPWNIQTNEINYLKSLVGEDKVFAGADEVGLDLLSKFAKDQYVNDEIEVVVNYFGDGKLAQADFYDYNTLDSNVSKHIKLSGGTQVKDNGDLEVLVLTRPINTDHLKNVSDLNKKMNFNADNNIPTVVIDASGNEGELQKLLFKNSNTPTLIAYSSWNTVGNMVGMGIGYGIGRVAFLMNDDDNINKSIEKSSLINQVKLLFTEFVVDVSYQLEGKKEIDSYIKSQFNGDDDLVFSLYSNESIRNNKEKYDEIVAHSSKILSSLNEHNAFSIQQLATLFSDDTNKVFKTYISPSDFSYAKIDKINLAPSESDLFELSFPWHRTFEIRFLLDVQF